MGFIRIGPNGEISLPREAWDALGLKPGDRVELVTDPASRSVTLHPPAPSSPAHRRTADALIGTTNAEDGCATTLTFDRKAAGLPHFAALPLHDRA